MGGIVAPAVDDRNEFIGFISEFDVLHALEAGKDLSNLTAEDIMVCERIAVTAETTIEEAVKTMEEKRLLNLPVKRDRKVVDSVARHDLLRAWIASALRAKIEKSRLRYGRRDNRKRSALGLRVGHGRNLAVWGR